MGSLASRVSPAAEFGYLAGVEQVEPVPLTAPRDGIPHVVETTAELDAAIEALAAGTGPVAIDAERAGGYRYDQRAYLVQLRREGSGTWLIDPVDLPDLSDLAEAIQDAEWIIHAASQDLPCLRDLGMRPVRLFDTELAGRLLDLPRVGLATLVTTHLGISLAKEHSAVDWSTRPLPESWLAYAALDVEVLVELRDLLAAELRDAGKWDWAVEEFEALVAGAHAPPPPPRTDPWRRTSGIHRIRKPRNLAVVRSLWQARDRLAQRRDVAPGRVLVDSAIATAATKPPTSRAELAGTSGFDTRGQRRNLDVWWEAVAEALALPESDLPASAAATDGPPPPRAWKDRWPDAAARLEQSRAAVAEIGERVHVPSENVILPDTLRRICWEPPAELSPETVAHFLRERGAREWQIGLLAEPLVEPLQAVAQAHPVNEDTVTRE